MGLSLIPSCLFKTHFISLHLFSTLSLLLSRSHIAGEVFDHNDEKSYFNEVVEKGDEWSMEVDLRSREKEERTLHWFVRGKQQKGFFKGVPDRVEFGV